MMKSLFCVVLVFAWTANAYPCDPATALAFDQACGYGGGQISGQLSVNIPFSLGFQQPLLAPPPPISILPVYSGFAFSGFGRSYYPRYYGGSFGYGGGFRTLPAYGGGFAFSRGFGRSFGAGTFIEQNGRRNRIVGGGFAPGTTIIQNGRRNRIIR